MSSMPDYSPRPEHKFSFGLWTVSNRGRDPFGEAVRPTLSPVDAAAMLGDVGGAIDFQRVGLSDIRTTIHHSPRITTAMTPIAIWPLVINLLRNPSSVPPMASSKLS